MLAHAEDDEVGLGVEHDRSADGIAPVVVMSQPAQGCLDASGNHRHTRKGLAGPLAIGERRPVRPKTNSPARAIGIVVADLLAGGVVVDHAVHVAGADAEEQPGPSKLPPGLRALRQSGWLRIATRKPAASSTRPRIPMANAG